MRGSWILFLIAASLLLGCQTTRSWDEGCPGVYSGVRYYRDQLGGLPVDGKIFCTLDLPITIAADPALLPVRVLLTP